MVGGNKHMGARMLGIAVKILYCRLVAYRFLQGQFGLMFLPLNPLPCQNDPDFHATSFVSVQSDVSRLSLYIRRAAPVASIERRV